MRQEIAPRVAQAGGQRIEHYLVLVFLFGAYPMDVLSQANTGVYHILG